MKGHTFPKFSEAYKERWRKKGLWTDLTLHQGFDDTVRQHPDKIALYSKDRSYSFAEFKQQSDALAAGLLGIGVQKGDIVAVQLPNWVEFCFLQIALSRIGAVIQSSHMVFREREIGNLYRFCQTDFVVVPERFKDFGYADMMRGLRPELPRIRKLIVARGQAEGADECTLADLIADGAANLQRLESVQVSPDDIFYLNFTSGTEGNPKGFLHTHNTLMTLLKAYAQRWANSNPNFVSLACSPMTHTFGHFSTYYTALGGVPMVLLDSFRPDEVLSMIDKCKVTHISGTPAHLISVLRHPDYAKYDTSQIKSVQVGGARSSPELIKELEDAWGVKSANTYGMGETIIHTATVPTDDEAKIRETVGRPIPGTEVRIVSPTDRSMVLPPGEVGEICYRGPNLFVGYHNQPEITAKTRDDEGWFYTSDLGMLDADGYLHYVGRAKEVINRGGSKIYPKEIEDVLNSYARIREAAVVGIPDERLGERVFAYVVPEGEDVTLDEISRYFAEMKVMKYMHPEFLVNLKEMPMTPTGKVRKATLQEDVIEQARKLASA